MDKLHRIWRVIDYVNYHSDLYVKLEEEGEYHQTYVVKAEELQLYFTEILRPELIDTILLLEKIYSIAAVSKVE